MRRERSQRRGRGDGAGVLTAVGVVSVPAPGAACRFSLRGPAFPAQNLPGGRPSSLRVGGEYGRVPCHHSRDVRMGFWDACLPPRDWLQRRQTVRVFSRVSSPPCAWGTMWSASALLGSRDTL